MASLELQQESTSKQISRGHHRFLFHYSCPITSRLTSHWGWNLGPWKQEIEDICDYTSLLKDTHRSDPHSLRLADNIISVVKWVLLLMVCEPYTGWLSTACERKLFQVLWLSKCWLAPTPGLKVNRCSFHRAERLAQWARHLYCQSPVTVLILARNHPMLTEEMPPLLGNKNKTMEERRKDLPLDLPTHFKFKLVVLLTHLVNIACLIDSYR